MLNLKFKTLLLSLYCISAFTANAQISTKELQTFLESEIVNKRTKGIVVGIIDANGGKQIISAGKLSDNNSKKPDGNTLFEIASVTKLFTTLALADYANKNEVSLKDGISNYLPKKVKTPVFDNQEITLLHLASHTSGLPRFPFNQFPNNPVDNYSVEDLYYYLSEFKPNKAFGTAFKYSNTGMGLIGHILSLQAKQPFDAIVNETICKKLKLNNTTFSPTNQQKLNIASGHLPYGQKTAHYHESEGMKGAGGLYSSVNDLLKFAALGLDLEQNELSSAMQLTQTKVGNLGYEMGYDAEILYDYGMGWNIWTKNGRTIHWKDGTSFGFRSFICLDREKKKGVVILSNSFNPINDIGLHLIDATYQLKPYKYQWGLIDSLKKTYTKAGIDRTIDKYLDLKKSANKEIIFHEEVLYYLAKELSLMKKNDHAIKLHQLNIDEYPKSSMPLESMGNLYFEMGNKTKALEYYTKALVIEPKNLHFQWVIDQLKK
ncbi:MAG: serine hydrolase [Saprospiraceae bacterium]|nr:serine hydrolase [Saprospiraceae bacterium]